MTSTASVKRSLLSSMSTAEAFELLALIAAPDSKVETAYADDV